MLLFLISFVASVNENIGYNYLMEYYPEVVSYHKSSISGGGYYDFEESEAGQTYTSTTISYYKRYYSLGNDLNLKMTPGVQFRRLNSENYITTYLGGYGDYKIYPTTIPFFVSFGADFSGSWNTGPSFTDYSTGGEFKAGIGFGRMIPLSTAYEALKIEEELIELEELDENFSTEDLNRITEFLRNSNRYLDEREFWADFENIIKESRGFNSDRLGSVPTIRIDEIINSGSRYLYSMQRDRGYDIRGYAGFEFSKNNITIPETSRGKFFLGGNLIYSRPLSTRLQFLFDSEIETYVSDSVGIKSIDISSSFYYEVLKKLYLTFSFAYSKDIYRYGNGTNREYIDISLNPTYYIQYRMSVRLGGSFRYYIDHLSYDDMYIGSLDASIIYYLF